MRTLVPILSITGSDSTGGAGVQGDIKTVSSLGGYAVTVLTSVTVQNSEGIHSLFNLPLDIVEGQLRSVLNDVSPKAVKLGLLGSADNLDMLVRELKGLSNIVCAPGIESSKGELLIDKKSMAGLLHKLLQVADLLVLKKREVELLSGKKIESITKLEEAARILMKFGAKNVLLLGGTNAEGVITNILVMNEGVTFFTLPQSDRFKTHGMVGTLSSAIATYLGKGCSLIDSVNRAHDYLNSIVLLSIELPSGRTARMIDNNKTDLTDRQVEVYNEFMRYVVMFYKEHHEVQFYADKLCVTSRYLSQITAKVSRKSPKMLIDEYLIQELKQQITCTKATIQEICFTHGFSSLSQFSKFFKKMTGESPSRLRARND